MAEPFSDIPIDFADHLSIDPRAMLNQLHETALKMLFGESSPSKARKVLDKAPEAEQRLLLGKVERALQGPRLERDDLEALAIDHAVVHGKATPSSVIVLGLIEKLSEDSFDQEVERLLRPLGYTQRGSFATYAAPAVIKEVDANKLGLAIELAFEDRLSKGRDKRRARVRVRPDADDFLLVFYFERGGQEGRGIDSKKKIVIKQYGRPAADTFLWVRRVVGATRIVQKQGSRITAAMIRAALGEALWNDELAVGGSPVRSYQLNRALEPTFQLSPLENAINSAGLHEIELRLPSGNFTTIKARGESHDVLPDFRALMQTHTAAKIAPDIRSMTLKLTVTVGQKTKIVPLTVRHSELTVDAAFLALAERQLSRWGILGD